MMLHTFMLLSCIYGSTEFTPSTCIKVAHSQYNEKNEPLDTYEKCYAYSEHIKGVLEQADALSKEMQKGRQFIGACSKEPQAPLSSVPERKAAL